MAVGKKQLEKITIKSTDFNGDYYLHGYEANGVRISKMPSAKGIEVYFIPYDKINYITHKVV